MTTSGRNIPNKPSLPRRLCKLGTNLLFEYETPRILEIHDKHIGILNRIVQTAIIAYIAISVMYRNRGYQTQETLVSGVAAKTHGIIPVVSQESDGNFSNHLNDSAQHVMDASDYLMPPLMNSAVFITTNFISTPNQRFARCSESLVNYHAGCRSAAQCRKGGFTKHGVMSGSCVNTTKRCEIWGWCPPEEDRFTNPRQTILPDIVNATVFIKNSIEFRKFHVKRKNVLKFMTRSYLRKCRFHREHYPFCPIFRLGDILQHANVNQTEALMFGALISLVITWDCDLDKHVDNCLPKYSFSRLDKTDDDDKKKSYKEKIRGFNFRYSTHYQNGEILYRTLTKAYGIYLFIVVEGKAWKFDIKEFTMNIGSGVGLMGIASTICDIFAFYLTNKRKKYWSKKIHGRGRQ